MWSKAHISISTTTERKQTSSHLMLKTSNSFVTCQFSWSFTSPEGKRKSKISLRLEVYVWCDGGLWDGIDENVFQLCRNVAPDPLLHLRDLLTSSSSAVDRWTTSRPSWLLRSSTWSRRTRMLTSWSRQDRASHAQALALVCRRWGGGRFTHVCPVSFAQISQILFTDPKVQEHLIHCEPASASPTFQIAQTKGCWGGGLPGAHQETGGTLRKLEGCWGGETAN